MSLKLYQTLEALTLKTAWGCGINYFIDFAIRQNYFGGFASDLLKET